MIKTSTYDGITKKKNFKDILAIFDVNANKNQTNPLNNTFTEAKKENSNIPKNNNENRKKEENLKGKNIFNKDLNIRNQFNNKNKSKENKNYNQKKNLNEYNSFQTSHNIFKTHERVKSEIIILKEENEKNNNEKDSQKKEEDNFKKNKLNAFNKINEQKDNKEKEKINLSDKIKKNIGDKKEDLLIDLAAQEKKKQINKDNKKEENKNKSNNQIKEKPNSNIQKKGPIFGIKCNTSKEINNNVKKTKQQDNKILGGNNQKKIQNLPNQNKSKEMQIKRNKEIKKNFEPSIIEKLKLLYQPNDTNTIKNSNVNKTFKSENTEEIINRINQKGKEKEKMNKEFCQSKTKIFNKESEKNIEINDNKTFSESNKNLYFSKIFGINVEKITSLVNESKKQEIIQFAQEQMEENQKMDKEIDSDNSEDEKEKGNIINKNKQEKKNNLNQLENLPNLDDNIKNDKGRESYKIDNLINKIKTKFNFFKPENSKLEIIDNKNNEPNPNDENIVIDENTNSTKDKEKPIKVNIDEISKKMRKALPLFTKMDSSSSIATDDIFLPKEILPKDKKPEHDTFCEGFFLASFSKDNSKIMEDSLDNQAECNHSICNILPAMQPEILYKYPKEDVKGLEINNLAASICFPNGIKLCYEQKEDNIKAVKNYRSSFTNQVGDRFFAVTYHFFLRKSNSVFESEQNMSPFQYEIIKYQDEMRTLLNGERVEDIYDRLTILGNLSKRDFVNIPYCLCLISKYPFIEQMEKCLESILMSINDENLNVKDLNKYISYIVSSIPAPSGNCKILFPLAYHYRLEEIQPLYFRDINQLGDNPLIILNYIQEKNIYTLFKLLVFEQKVIIIGKDNDLISQIILNFVTLLYPFEWIHTFIPIMSEKMLKFLQAFLPFFIGINATLLKKAKPILARASKGVFIFNIDDNTLNINSNYKENSKPINTLEYINTHIPNFPKALEQLILKELKSINVELSRNKDQDKLNLNLRIKNLFMEIFAEILYDYKKYSYIVDNYPVFNSFLLINDRDKKDIDFYKELTSTQLFQMFIQNSLFKEDDKISYFEERLYELKEVRKIGASIAYNLEKVFQHYIKDYSRFAEIKKKFVIKPFFIKEFKKIEDENLSKNKKIKLSDIVKFLAKYYDKPKFTHVNDHGVLFENKRVINKPIELSNDYDPKEIIYYYLPKSKDVVKDNSINKRPTLKRNKTLKVGIISKEEDNKKNNIKISKILPNKENELSKDEIDEIKDNIKEIMSRLYKSHIRKIEEDKKLIFDSLKTQFGREYFTNILHNGYKQDFLVKELINQSYNFFFDVIFNTLLDILKLEENDANIICAVKLIKSCQYIATIKDKKKFLLSDELYKKLERYSLCDKTRFWEYWVEDEMTKDELNFKQSFETNYIDTESKEYKTYSNRLINIIEKLTSLMIKMKISNNSIITHIYELSKEFLFDDKQIQNVRDEAYGQIHIFQTYSKRNPLVINKH